MDKVGKHLLADAGFTRDENGDIRLAHLQCHVRDLFHRWTLCDERIVLRLLLAAACELTLVALDQ